MATVNISGYKFIELANLQKLKARLKQHCTAVGLKGTILLSTEGININLCGDRAAIARFRQYIARFKQLAHIDFKESLSEQRPFSRMWVKIKKEVITMGAGRVDTSKNGAHTLAPSALKQWLDEGRDVALLDTRNDYEALIGGFEKARQLSLKTFKDIPAKVPALVKQWGEEQRENPDGKLVMYCTGGVRCDKLLPLLLAQGVKNVYQLEGGVLNYFKQCGSAHYQGECFVFDDRIAVDPALKETQTILCQACQMPVTAAQQQRPEYVMGESCPHCV